MIADAPPQVKPLTRKDQHELPERMNVVLFSGGMDSTACLNHVAKRYGHENVVAIIFKYSSVHNREERLAATRVLNHLGVRSTRVTLPKSIFQGAGSTLMGEGEIPDGKYRTDGPQSTVVPFRNGVFISAAAAYASRYGNASIWIAAHADDSENWAYPDCSPDFLEAMSEAISVASVGQLELIVPYQYFTKAAIIEGAWREEAPLHLSYSCYRGTVVHCGQCATCRDRHKAFYYAGFTDPTEYMQLPEISDILE